MLSLMQLITDTLDHLIVNTSDFTSDVDCITLSSKVAAVHIAYHTTEHEIFSFGQLASVVPGILEPLHGRLPPARSPEMVCFITSAHKWTHTNIVYYHFDTQLLHLYAVEKALDILKPPNDGNKADMMKWLNKLRPSLNAVESTLNLPTPTELRIRLRAKYVSGYYTTVLHTV